MIEHDPAALRSSPTTDVVIHDDTDRVLQVEEEDCLTDDETAALAGHKLDASHYHTLIGHGDTASDNVLVLKPDGSLLAVYLGDEIDEDAATTAYTALRAAAFEGGAGNRGMATGKGSRKRRVREDGSISNTNAVADEVRPLTGIVGYFDRYPRIPYCRQTAYTINNPTKWDAAIPFFQRCDALFAEYVPDRYHTQLAKAKQTEEDWIISQTAFTTVTVNLNWQTAVHQDAGDLPEGFGVMPVVSLGDYEGAYFIQPKFGVAYDVRTRDMLLNDVHEWHGNGPFTDSSGYYERLSCVLYYRREMEACGTRDEELTRAKQIGDERDTRDLDDDALEQVTTTTPSSSADDDEAE